MEKTLTEQIEARFDELLKEKSNVTVWDAFLSLVEGEDTFLLSMKADVPILECLAKGFSLGRTAGYLSIPAKDVQTVADVWGVTPSKVTLDFNPLLVYNRGMSGQELKNHMSDILPTPLSDREYDSIIANIEVYNTVDRYLREMDNERDEEIRQRKSRKIRELLNV